VYPGDNAKPAQIAAWMGQEARRRGIPPELPIMASLTESGMQNLDHGDRDSLGYFQMRLSVWNGGPYAGYANNPKRQLDWFLDQAQAVGKQRQARGQSTTDPRQYGDWIADVERPAQEYRGRYQGHLAEARSLLAQSDNGQGKQGQGNQGVDQLVDAAASPGPGKKAVAALALVRKQMGTPYLWGGSSPKTGFDCSGLMQWAYAQVGVRIPRVTYDQIDAPGAQHIARNKLMPGDLVFFKNASGDVHHVGMSLGGDKFVHAPHTGDVVKVSSLKDAYYAGEFTGGRRFVPALAGGQNPAVGALAGVAGAHAAIDAPAPARADVDAINAGAVKLAMAALEEDGREANRPGSLLHQLLTRQEIGKGNAAMFLPAISAEP
jgi:cell wall-associated NlpC family hydrolase